MDGGRRGAVTDPTASYIAMNSGGNVSLGSFGNVVTVDSASDQVLQFPTLTTVTGKRIGVAKMGVGKVTITAPVDASIQDSALGGSIYCDDGTMARIELEVISATQIGIVCGVGTWTTTE